MQREKRINYLKTPVYSEREEGKVTLLYLDVIMRIPVRVVNDDGVGGGQVDPQTSGPRGQQEGKLLGARSWG